MTDFFASVWWLIVALGVLVSVHEFGHFWVARRLGIKVLRFSIGFGRAVWKRRAADGCEYRIGWVPLGGYVKMLDEREGEVAAQDLPRAFNRQPVWSRIAVVVAGPLINLFLALALFWLAFMIGIEGLRPLVGDVSGLARDAGLRNGDLIVSVSGRELATWESVNKAFLEQLREKKPVQIEVLNESGGKRRVWLPFQQLPGDTSEARLLTEIGLSIKRPPVPARLEQVEVGGPAASAGLQAKDEITAIDGNEVASGFDWRGYLRSHAGKQLNVTVQRGGRSLSLPLTPEARQQNGQIVGIIGVRLSPLDPAALQALRGKYLSTERFGPLDAMVKAVSQVGFVTRLTVNMISRMLVGRASLENLSGPVLIANYARQEARLGLSRFLQFLGLLSVSLFLLNLLPIPVLDGGHLLYYVVELVRGKPLPQRVQVVGHLMGMFVLATVMVFVLFQDVQRVLG